MVKKMQISTCLGHLILRLILVLFWSCKGLAQSSSSLLSSTESSLSSTVSLSSLHNTPSSWTFVGTGYLAFYPTIFSNQKQDYRLLFRTRHSFGSVFCHILKDYKTGEHSLLDSYKLCAEIRHGSLYIVYKLNKYTETIVIGKGKMSYSLF